MTQTKKLLKGLHINLPSKWSDLTPAQVTRIAYHLSTATDQTEMLVQLGLEFADLRPHGTAVTDDGSIAYVYYDRRYGNVTLTAEHVAAIAAAMKWVTAEPQPMAAPLLDGYEAPDSSLYGVSLERYLTAETACGRYLSARDAQALQMMCASLYLRPGCRFDSEAVASEAVRMAYLPRYALEAVLLWFVGAKKLLMRKYPLVFTEADGQQSAPTDGAEIMLGLLSSLNEGRIVDNEKLRGTDIHEALYELNRRIKATQKDR